MYAGRKKAGDIIARDNSKVLVLAWKDKRVVKAISTKHDASTTMVTRRKSAVGGVWRKSPNPHALLITTRKSLKRTTKVFYLMEINVHNAYVLYLAQSRTKKYKHLSQFVLQLVKQLLPLEEPDAAETGGEGGCTAQIYISHCVHFATMISSVFVCLQPKSMNH